MKIVHIEDYFDPEAGYQINELIKNKNNLNDKYFIITSTDMTPFYKSVDKEKDKFYELENKVKIIRLKPIFKISSRILLKGLDKTIKKINPDVVFMHGIGDFKDIILWKKKTKYKIYRDCHMSWVASKNKFKNLYYFFYKYFFSKKINSTNKYEKIFALGIEEYEYLKKLGINDNKIDFLYHGYDKNIMYFDGSARKNIRSKYNILEDEILISYIGKFDYSKKPDLIFDIINNINGEYIKKKKIKFLFMGPKNEEYMNYFNSKMKKYVDNKEIEIILEESKPFYELKNYFSASDICVFPKETTLSSIHAQVCLNPVIMENYTSNKERVINNNNLYNKNAFKEASLILKRIIDNEEYIKDKNKKYANQLLEREYSNQIKKLNSYFRSKSK
jgi:glycosyltransferase involved in cell wall biosynthesis